MAIPAEDRTMYQHIHKAFDAMRLGSLRHPDTVIIDNDNIWYCFYHNVSQLMGVRYSPELKQKFVQTSSSIQSYHMMN